MAKNKLTKNDGRTILKTVGERIRWARKEKLGITQVELGKLAGYSQRQISHLEGGNTKNPRNLDQLAGVLKESPAWILFGKEELDNLDQDSINFALIYQNLPAASKKSILSLAKQLAEK